MVGQSDQLNLYDGLIQTKARKLDRGYQGRIVGRRSDGWTEVGRSDGQTKARKSDQGRTVRLRSDQGRTIRPRSDGPTKARKSDQGWMVRLRSDHWTKVRLGGVRRVGPRSDGRTEVGLVRPSDPHSGPWVSADYR